MNSSPSLEQLLAEAREDAPPSAVRDEVWGRVAAATAATSLAAAPASKALGLSTAGKLVSLGAALGVVGALSVVYVASSSSEHAGRPPMAKPREVAPHAERGAIRLDEPASRPRAESAAASVAPVVGGPRRAAPSSASTLEEEARLVTEMREALRRGDADQALALSRIIDRLPVRALEPEQLALRMRAFRALDRAEDALADEMTLRRRFPDHALSH